MKRYLLLVIILLIPSAGFSQEKADSVKRGWNFGILPAVAFDSDLGVYYGLILNPFDYKDGSIYPNYFQSVYLQISAYSRGSYEHILRYESYSLLPSVKLFTELKFVGYKAYPFYGFNGNEAIYNYDWEDQESPDYKTRVFYRLERKYFRLSADLQDTIGSSRFQWRAGWSLGDYRIAPVNVARINEKKDPGDQLPEVPGLYDRYIEWQILDQDEKDGGLTNSFMLGLLYDSRNKLTNPDRGIFTEFTVKYMPASGKQGYGSSLSLGLIHKQYFTIISRRLIFAYRIWWNSNIAGSQPFYTRQLLTNFSMNEGFGGSGTIRGALMQRIVANDFLLGSAELRGRIFNYRFINQNWYFGAVLFMDAGKILKPFDVNTQNVPEYERSDYFGTPDRSIHKSFGGGLKMAMNENFVLSAEFAVPAFRQDGTYGLYLGLGYQF